MGQASRGSPRSGDSWPLEQDGVWEWSSKGVGWGEEAPVREFGSLHPAPLFSFQTTTDRYMDTWKNSLINPCYKENGLMACTTCLDKIHLKACMHSFDLHCVLRKTHIRDVMPWTRVEIQNLGLDQIRARALSFSLSLSLEKQLWRGCDTHNCIHLKEIFTFVLQKKGCCLFQGENAEPEKTNSKVPSQVFNHTDPVFIQQMQF